jgi:hypothetical protein
MPTYAFAAPILPGKLPVLKETVNLMSGDRRSEAEAIRREAGLDREQVFVHHTPMGEFAIVVWDTADFQKVLKTLSEATGEFARWFQSQLLEVHGFDVTDLANVPEVTLAGEWKSDDWTWDAGEGVAVCFPMQDGTWDVGMSFIEEMIEGEHRSDFIASRNDVGMTRQSFWGMHTPNGDVAVMYGEGKPGWFEEIFPLNATSGDPFYSWFREGIMEFSAAPIFAGGSAPQVDQVFDMVVNTPVTA